MWIIILILFLLLWKSKEGFSSKDDAERQIGIRRYIEFDIHDITSRFSQSKLDIITKDLSLLEEKVTTLETNMKEYLETKKVNDAMGYT